MQQGNDHASAAGNGLHSAHNPSWRWSNPTYHQLAAAEQQLQARKAAAAAGAARTRRAVTLDDEVAGAARKAGQHAVLQRATCDVVPSGAWGHGPGPGSGSAWPTAAAAPAAGVIAGAVLSPSARATAAEHEEENSPILQQHLGQHQPQEPITWHCPSPVCQSPQQHGEAQDAQPQQHSAEAQQQQQQQVTAELQATQGQLQTEQELTDVAVEAYRAAATEAADLRRQLEQQAADALSQVRQANAQLAAVQAQHQQAQRCLQQQAELLGLHEQLQQHIAKARARDAAPAAEAQRVLMQRLADSEQMVKQLSVRNVQAATEVAALHCTAASLHTRLADATDCNSDLRTQVATMAETHCQPAAASRGPASS
jgi:DNA repair exonuclease SbcCD ATPase subunit